VTGSGWHGRRVALIGAGARADYTMDRARKLATGAGLAARQRRVSNVAMVVGQGREPLSDLVQATAEGLTLADFDSAQYKTTDAERVTLSGLQIIVDEKASDLAALERAAARGRTLGECSNLARILANEPSNTLTPRVFAERASALVSEAGIRVDVLDEKRIAELRMGLLLGVAQGSHEPPRLIAMRHDPPNAPPTPVLGLVGKGITFDTGGISIKPADGMERMKDDMAGGAAVVCAMRAIGLLNAPIRVIGIVPTTENMPGGHAVKPGDVLKSANGKTVEVINTDAEGRLILGDGLWYAQQLGATHLVDVATLTGACVVALGKITSGLFGTPDSWVEHVRRVADRAGDRSWPMPVFDEYREQLKSEIADMINSAGRPAGAITAAMFLKEFAGGLPWVHMDIAGTAWAEETRPYQPKGATGIAVRTLAELAFAADRFVP
jgi:leucyl aminopeptidase